MNKLTGRKALRLIEKLLTAKSLLVIHGILSDGERDRANKRIEKWAMTNGLKRVTR